MTPVSVELTSLLQGQLDQQLASTTGILRSVASILELIPIIGAGLAGSMNSINVQVPLNGTNQTTTAPTFNAEQLAILAQAAAEASTIIIAHSPTGTPVSGMAPSVLPFSGPTSVPVSPPVPTHNASISANAGAREKVPHPDVAAPTLTSLHGVPVAHDGSSSSSSATTEPSATTTPVRRRPMLVRHNVNAGLN